MRKLRNCIAWGTLVISLVVGTIGCQANHAWVPQPPEDTYTAMEFGDHFNTEMIENEYRVRSWVTDSRIFRLRLADIRVGDGTLSYESGQAPFADSDSDLHVKCLFDDRKSIYGINNGDTVDLVGHTVKAKRGWQRIILELDRCTVSKVEIREQNSVDSNGS